MSFANNINSSFQFQVRSTNSFEFVPHITIAKVNQDDTDQTYHCNADYDYDADYDANGDVDEIADANYYDNIEYDRRYVMSNNMVPNESQKVETRRK